MNASLMTSCLMAPRAAETVTGLETRATVWLARPHRGGLILTLGVLSLFVMGLILGPLAWILGTNDLRAMDAGVMDPAGRELTQAGRICGIIATFINVAALALTIGVLTIVTGAMLITG